MRPYDILSMTIHENVQLQDESGIKISFVEVSLVAIYNREMAALLAFRTCFKLGAIRSYTCCAFVTDEE